MRMSLDGGERALSAENNLEGDTLGDSHSGATGWTSEISAASLSTSSVAAANTVVGRGPSGRLRAVHLTRGM